MAHATTEFKIIGHRGAAGLLPENTLPSFRRALELGCHWLELDVHCIADGSLVVIHDDSLDRTTNAQGSVAALQRQDLSSIDAGNGASIPTLTEVCTEISRHSPMPVTLNIELKGANTAHPVATFLDKSKDLPAHIIVSSFDHTELARFRSQDAQTAVAVLLHQWQSDWLRVARAVEATAVNMSTRIVTKKRVEAIKNAGYSVYVYTVNRPARASKLAEMGVDGIFTDRPDRMRTSMSQI